MSAHKRGGLLKRVKRIVCDANKTLVAVGGFVSALAAVIATVVLLLPGGPPSPEAKIEQASVDPNVLIEQYVETGEASASASTGSWSRLRLGGDRLAVNDAAAFARPAVAVLALVSTSSPATGVSSSLASSATQDEAAHKEDEQVKQELQQQRAQATKEAETQSEQAKLDEEKALAERNGQPQETGTGEESQAQRAARATAEAAAAEAKAQQASAEARLTAREAATVKQEEEHPSFTAPPASSTPLRSVGDAKVLTGTGAPAREVEDVIQMAGVKASAKCGTSCPLRTTVERAIADTSSNLEQAAEEVAAVFRGSRVQDFEHKLQPIGVTVDYGLRLVGYAGKRAFLEWTLCSKRTGRPLPREWWRNVIVKQIEPTSDDAPVTGSFWAPIPPARGDYYFRLRVFYNGLEVADRETGQFS
jgi:hypothetical protein